MNILFFGSSSFSVPCLKALLSTQHQVDLVVTQPDAKKGRGLGRAETPVKAVAIELGLKIFQPKQVNCEDSLKTLERFNPDLFVVVAYGQILSAQILAIPKIFALNVHASILPKYRGAAPINWTIINGEKSTGISIIKMVEKLDAGPIILQNKTEILPQDNAATLEDKLAALGAETLISAICAIENNNYRVSFQDEKEACLAPKLKREDGMINWDEPAVKIVNLIRGCIGWPEAFTYYKGRLLKIHKADALIAAGPKRLSAAPGQILEVLKEAITVATREGNLVIRELQIEGKRKMRVEEFIPGHRICVGERFEKK